MELESSGQVHTADAISNAGLGYLLLPPLSVALITETGATTVRPRQSSGQDYIYVRQNLHGSQ